VSAELLAQRPQIVSPGQLVHDLEADVVPVALVPRARIAEPDEETHAASYDDAPPPPPAGAVVLAKEDGDLAVALAAEPHSIRVTVLGPDGTGVDGLRVTVLGAPTGGCGAGCYHTDASPAPAVPVRVNGRTLVFHFPRTAPSAARLVARATQAFRSLSSVTYVERLASSPRDRIVSDFTLERPDRVEYRIAGGASGIVIGTRRWDRARPGGAWTKSTSTPLVQPVPVWGSPLTNAHVLARGRSGLVVSFFNPKVPAWFMVRLDRRTLLPRELEMTAAAHFMHHRYVAFNRPRSIFRP
jgi:hypothetical protein